MVDELPQRDPGRSQIPAPRIFLEYQPPPNLAELARLADALRQWKTSADNWRPQ